jgi:hypothetical protein
MKIKMQIVVEREDTESPLLEELIVLERKGLEEEILGLSLDEGKNILANIQNVMIEQQTGEYLAEQSVCNHCHAPLKVKNNKNIVYRTLFGKLTLGSPRFYTCPCHHESKKSFSPLVQCLKDRTSPELLYLQSKWSSLMSYGVTADLLEEILPIKVSIATTMRNTQKIAQKIESELGDEQFMFTDGCERDWEQLPPPNRPLTVGIDGGYIHGREGKNGKADHFEVIVGKSIQEDNKPKRFGFVSTYDKKPKRRLYETLKSQGLQMNQTIEFFSDGGDTVRDLQQYLSPNSEFYLDWFHVTMRLTVLLQMCKGFPKNSYIQEVSDDIESVKWYLWHGNVYMALQKLDNIVDSLSCANDDLSDQSKFKKLMKTAEEFQTYISLNRNFITDYGDRYYYGETISSSFVESTVNEVISKRMVKKQQMQ